MTKYITMKEIAKNLGVSQSAVSFALNDRYDGVRISDDVRDKIKKTAAQMGYTKNAVVQSLVSGRTKLLAYISWEIGKREYIARNIEGAIQESASRGYLMKLFLKKEETRIEDIFEQIKEQRIEGVLFQGRKKGDIEYLLENGKKAGIPTAIVDHVEKNTDRGIYVKSDDTTGVKQAVTHLHSLGHRDIAFFGFLRGEERHQIFRKTMKKLKLKINEENIFFSHDKYERIIKSQKFLLRPKSERPTAVFCATDFLAMVLSREAWKLGIKIPEELSVIGFAGLQSIDQVYPELTTVIQPFEEVGEAAVKTIIEELESNTPKSFKKSIEIRVPTQLAIRETTAKPAE